MQVSGGGGGGASERRKGRGCNRRVARKLKYAWNAVTLHPVALLQPR